MSNATLLTEQSSKIKISTPPGGPAHNLESHVLEVRNLDYMMEAMGWSVYPSLKGRHLTDYAHVKCLNGRRMRDAEVLGAACSTNPEIMLEIGTCYGHSTALMARNAPNAQLYTVNIPPEEIEESGTFYTAAPTREEIGSYYRGLGITNVTQIFANTANWGPDFGPIDIAFIDGCHDAEYAYNDTVKVLKQCRSGSLILWHDLDLSMRKIHKHIDQVCRGIEQLYIDKIIKGWIYHMQDSWIGVYQVP